jgi:quercetin dioxygenase-like cupin family protein
MLTDPRPRPCKHPSSVSVIDLLEPIGSARPQEFGVRRPFEIASHNLYMTPPQKMCHAGRSWSGAGSGRRRPDVRQQARAAEVCPYSAIAKLLTTRPEVAPRIRWREGVETRLHKAGVEALLVMEQWCAPGTGAPPHTHFAVGEVIVVLDGTAEFWVDDVTKQVAAGGSIVLPAHSHHGFRNTGTGELHTLAVFASAHPLVEFDQEPGVVYAIDRHLRRLNPRQRLRGADPSMSLTTRRGGVGGFGRGRLARLSGCG